MFVTKTRVLIVCQAVDLDDPLNGFFHAWLENAAQSFAEITVLALRVGRYSLPPHVRVCPLRSAHSRSRWEVVRTVLVESWKRRASYDAVFVRQDAQYVALAGWLWRLLGKRVVFWYTHYAARGPWFWLAWPWVSTQITSVAASNPLRFALPVGHGIDCEYYSLIPRVETSTLRVLSFGRISPVKRVPWIAETLQPLVKEGLCTFEIIGTPTDAKEGDRVKQVLEGYAPAMQWRNENILPEQARDVYVNADVFVNATPGSLDKTIIEAAARGCIVLASTSGYGDGLPGDLRWLEFKTADELCAALRRIHAMRPEERQRVREIVSRWARENHSVERQLTVVASLLSVPRTTWSLRLVVKRCLRALVAASVPPPGVTVLMFHAFDGKGYAAYDPARLCQFILEVRTRGWRVLRLADVWDGVRWNIDQTIPTLLLTIDDGTEDVRLIVPILKALGVSGVLCAPAEAEGITTSDQYCRRVLTTSELRSLVDDGCIEISGHGATHRHLTEVGDDELLQELAASRSLVRAVAGEDVPLTLAYPRGRVDARVVAAAREAGFVGAFTTVPGRWASLLEPLLIPRYTVLNWMTSTDVLRECQGAGDRLRAIARLWRVKNV